MRGLEDVTRVQRVVIRIRVQIVAEFELIGETHQCVELDVELVDEAVRGEQFSEQVAHSLPVPCFRQVENVEMVEIHRRHYFRHGVRVQREN